MSDSIKFTYNDETDILIVNDNGSKKIFKLDKYGKIFKYIVKAIDELDGKEGKLTELVTLAFDSAIDVPNDTNTLSNVDPSSAEVDAFISSFPYDEVEVPCAIYGFRDEDFKVITEPTKSLPELEVKVKIDGKEYLGKFIPEYEDSGNYLPIGKWNDNDYESFSDNISTYESLGWNEYPFRLTNQEIDKDGHRGYTLFIPMTEDTANHSVYIALCDKPE